MKLKIILGVLLALVIAAAGFTLVANNFFGKDHAVSSSGDTMEALEMEEDSMTEMEMSGDSMDGMEMGGGSMAGMEMEGSHGKTVAGYTPITVDARKQQLIGVKTEAVNTRKLTRMIRAYGTVSHDPELYAVQQEYLSAYQYYQSLAGSDDQATAKLLLDSARKKLAILGYGEAQIKRLLAQGRTDDALIESAGSTRAWVYLQIYPNDLPYVRRGQSVRILGAGLRDKNIYGRIDSLDTVADPDTRSARARVLVQNADPAMIHESYVDAEIEVVMGTVLTVPEEAVIDAGNRRIAFVSQGEGYFEPRELVLGRRAGGFYEVISGVAVGEKVVSSANFFIDSESQLKAAVGNMSGHQHQ